MLCKSGTAPCEDTDKPRYPEEGDWVLVWGQIRRGRTHPEDVLVEFFSHNEQWAGHIRTDRVVISDLQPDFVTTCTAMFRYAGGANGLFVRCALHEGHSKKHRDSGGTLYNDDDVVGHFEEA